MASTDEHESELTRRAGSKAISVRLAQRARIVLLAAQGLQNKGIAEPLHVGRVQVARWREPYLQAGIEGIEPDLPQRGARAPWGQAPLRPAVGPRSARARSTPGLTGERGR